MDSRYLGEVVDLVVTLLLKHGVITEETKTAIISDELVEAMAIPLVKEVQLEIWSCSRQRQFPWPD